MGTEGVGIQELYSGMLDHMDDMRDLGQLDQRRSERYRQRVSALVRETLEDSFWTDDKIELLHKDSKTFDSIVTAPHIMAQDLLGNVDNE